MRIGLLVNPVAGLGGTVGLKGSSAQVQEEAIRRGGRPRGPARADEFLAALRDPDAHAWLTGAGELGEDALARCGLSAVVLHAATASRTTAHDTRALAAALADAGVDLLVFVGGDGTAADVAAGIGTRVPVLGVPAGVKMYSPVFAETPSAAAAVVDAGILGSRDVEVLDVDEEAYRRGELRVALKGLLRVPGDARVQSSKSAGEDDEVEQESLGKAVAESLEPGVTHILGAGTTMLAVKRALGVDGTLLGIDAVRDGRLVARDASEADLLRLEGPFSIVVSPIGGQGFVLGRGNLPISPAVVRRAGTAAVRVVATPTKLYETRALRIDAGDPAIDASFPDYVRVVSGYDRVKLMRLRRAAAD